MEVYNKVILQFVRCFAEGKKDRWDEFLPMLSMALHSSVHRQTGYSSNMLMLGREVLQPLDLMLGTVDRDRLPTTPSSWLGDYDLHLVERSYKVGDFVYMLLIVPLR